MSGTKRDCVCPRSSHSHGTVAGYDSDGCRCFRCGIAYSEWRSRWRAGIEDRERCTLDSTGTRRRLQALTFMGWSPPELANLLGMNNQAIMKLRNANNNRRVLISTQAAVADAYDRIWCVRSTGIHHVRMTNLAIRKGWAPPLAWDSDTIEDPAAKPAGMIRAHVINDDIDEIAIERRLSGDKVRLTYHETRHAVLELADRGSAVTTIAERLRLSGSRVNAILATREDTAA